MLMVGRKNSIDQPHIPSSSIGMKQCCLVVDFEGFLSVVVFFCFLLWCSSENGFCALIRPLVLEIL